MSLTLRVDPATGSVLHVIGDNLVLAAQWRDKAGAVIPVEETAQFAATIFRASGESIASVDGVIAGGAIDSRVEWRFPLAISDQLAVTPNGLYYTYYRWVAGAWAPFWTATLSVRQLAATNLPPAPGGPELAPESWLTSFEAAGVFLSHRGSAGASAAQQLAASRDPATGLPWIAEPSVAAMAAWQKQPALDAAETADAAAEAALQVALTVTAQGDYAYGRGTYAAGQGNLAGQKAQEVLDRLVTLDVAQASFDADRGELDAKVIVAGQHEAAAAVSAANAQVLTGSVQSRVDDAVATHTLTDQYNQVVAEFAGGRDLVMPGGVLRIEGGAARFLFDELDLDASTPAIVRLADGKVRIGVAGLYLTIDPVAGTISAPALAIGNAIGGITFTTAADGSTTLVNAAGGKIVVGASTATGQLGSLQVIETGGGFALVDGYSQVFAEFVPTSGVLDVAGLVIDSVAETITAPSGRQVAWAAPVTTGFSVEYIAARNAAAEARSAVLRARQVPGSECQGFIAKNVLFQSDGQSNSAAAQSFPPYPDAGFATLMGRALGLKMIGDSIHSLTTTSNGWTQRGAAAFNQLKPTVIGTAGAWSSILTPSQVAALPPTAGNLGQSTMESALSSFSFLRLRHLELATSDRVLIAVSVGVGGQSSAALSKGATPDLYRRLTESASIAKTIANAAGETIQSGPIIWNNGEEDGASGTPPADHAARVRQLRADHHADVTIGIFGQTDAPIVPMFTAQTADFGIINPAGSTAANIPAAGGLGIANAQLALALEDGGPIMVTGYRGTAKGLHYDVHQSSWIGQKIGFAMFRYYVLGLRPFPFSTHERLVRGNQMLVTFLTPTPPIKFVDIYDQYVVGLVQPTHKGLYVNDAAGDLVITDVSIVGSCSLLVTCSRAIGASPRLDAGRRTTPIGATNIVDSSTDTLIKHHYETGVGHAAETANVPWVNALFPGEQELALFSLPATPV